MAIEDKNSSNQQPTLQELLDYRAGKLEGKDRHKVEKFLLESELATDAFEGFDEFGNDESLQNITDQLNQKITNRAKQKPKLVVWYRKPAFSIAASLILLFTITSVFIWQLNEGSNELAMQKEMPAAEEPSAANEMEMADQKPTLEMPTASSAESQEAAGEAETSKSTFKEEKRIALKKQAVPQAAPPAITMEKNVMEVEEIEEEDDFEVDEEEEILEDVIVVVEDEVAAGASNMIDSSIVSVQRLEAGEIKKLEEAVATGRSMKRAKDVRKKTSRDLKKAKNLFIDGKYVDAALACDSALEEDPLNTDALILSGLSYLKGEIYDTAKNRLTVVKTFIPPILPKEELEQVLELMEEEKYEDATRKLQQIMPEGFLE
ncbi:hypothetical protein R9C00_02495 [Flammeovirgaceae bacterium SG7u.111]|nr:hypothetical protein [Flammeovirgaceae bacterium SG7u.132]WPO36309.1 hypothetical protein R9C00_02495 [Flammeovirgaceae bacterium SG7u.111]